MNIKAHVGREKKTHKIFPPFWLANVGDTNITYLLLYYIMCFWYFFLRNFVSIIDFVFRIRLLRTNFVEESMTTFGRLRNLTDWPDTQFDRLTDWQHYQNLLYNRVDGFYRLTDLSDLIVLSNLIDLTALIDLTDLSDLTDWQIDRLTGWQVDRLTD